MTGFTLVNILGGLLIVTSTVVVLARTAKKSAFLYMLQSFVLVLLLLSLGFATESSELFLWSASAFVTKVVLVPGILLYTIKKLGGSQEVVNETSPARSVAIIAIEVLVCFAAVKQVDLYTAAEVKPALAISLAHFFIGLTCIISQRNIVKQIFGYCLMENAPELVEIGIATDAIFAVLVMALVVRQIYRKTNSLDANNLMELKG